MSGGKMILKCIIAIAIGLFIFAGITYWLWNWLVPVIFNGPVISYWQALGLLTLTKILFFGIGGRKHCSPDAGQWKNRFNKKMATLTPEEREVFKKKMKEKWCGGANE